MRAVALAAGLVLTATAVAAPLTLDDYYAAALRRSETVASQGELIRQAEERHLQARSALYPTLSGVAAYTRHDEGATDTATNPTRQRNTRLTATQPLFRGFREFATLRQTRALTDAQDEDYRAARVQLFKDVAQNFYDVLTIEQDLINLSAQIEQYRQREKELQDRVHIGRSRVGEVLSVQATVGTLHAQIEQLRAQLGVAREALAFLSDLPSDTPLNDTEPPTGANPGPLNAHLARIELRPEVRAAQQRLTAAQENIGVARGAHLPSLDLNANRYFERSGSLENVEWDVQLALTVPLFAGGSVQSKVREAQSQHTQAELDANRARRLAEQEIRAAHQTAMLDRRQLDALQKATEAARKNYQAQQRDYRFGLVTNIDVLQALTVFQENQRALDRARYTAKLNALKLQAAVVRRPDLGADATP